MTTAPPAPSTELDVIKPGSYLALNHDPSELLEAFRVNLGDDRLSLFDLDKATVPGPGGTRWKVARGDGSRNDPETLTGVIIGVSNSRTYYAREYTGGGEVPDCASYDGGRTGVGDPGGTCHDCPLNVFGTARNGGAGKACAEGKHVLLLLPDNVLPMLITIPAVSLKFVRGYMTSLIGVKLPHWSVVTELAISTTSTQARSEVVCVKARKIGSLTPEEVAATKEYKTAIDGLLTTPAARGSQGGEPDVDAEAEAI